MVEKNNNEIVFGWLDMLTENGQHIEKKGTSLYLKDKRGFTIIKAKNGLDLIVQYQLLGSDY